MKIEESTEILKSLPLFSNLSKKELARIARFAKQLQFKKNSFVFMQGDEYRGFYIVLEGSVKVFKSSKEGKVVLMHLIRPFNQFADVPLFEGNKYPVNAQTLEETSLLFIPKEEFMNLLKVDNNLCLKMLAGFAKRLRSLTDKLEELVLKEVVGRLANYIVTEIEKTGKQSLPEPYIKLPISKSTLSALLGTANETLSRSLLKLEKEKIIREHHKTIFITDFKRLKKLAAG